MCMCHVFSKTFNSPRFQVKRTEWVLKWPGQVVLAGCGVDWAIEVTEALHRRALQQMFDESILPQLNDLRELVNQDISKIGRMTLAALIVVEVHARDVVINMLDNDVNDVNDFEWISQLRYADDLVVVFIVVDDLADLFSGQRSRSLTQFRKHDFT